MLSENEVWRFDASYFLREDIRRLRMLIALDHTRLGDECYVTDGIHTSIDFEEGSGIKVISAKHPKDGFLDLRIVEEISAASHEANPRTALKAGDVILSTVGTIGNAAVVQSEVLPANSDRHVAIIRVRDKNRPIFPEYISVFLNSSYGRMQSIRETTGNVQPNLFLEKIRDLKIPRFSEQFEGQIEACSIHSIALRREASGSLEIAESNLVAALGLADWTPPEPLAYAARAVDVFASGRFDAQYFMPAKEQVKQSLAALPGQLLSKRVDSIRDQWLPDRALPTMRVRMSQPIGS